MSRSAEAIVALVFAAAIALGGAPVAVRLWRNTSPSFNEPEALRRWGSARTGRAFRRAFPLGIFAFGLTACAWAATVLGGRTTRVTGVFLLLAGLCSLIGWLIVLVNRPKALVPPHLRDEPGLLRFTGRLKQSAGDAFRSAGRSRRAVFAELSPQAGGWAGRAARSRLAGALKADQRVVAGRHLVDGTARQLLLHDKARALACALVLSSTAEYDRCAR